MDEGVNTFFEFRYMAEKYRSNILFGEMTPAYLKKMDEASFLNSMYRFISQYSINAAIETPSDRFKSAEEYSLTVYVKAAEWLYLLEEKVGEEKLNKAFQHYFNLWQGRHPQPPDMQTAFEESIHQNLDDFFRLLHKEGSLSE